MGLCTSQGPIRKVPVGKKTMPPPVLAAAQAAAIKELESVDPEGSAP
jgi:hypothetical protein